MRNWLLMFVAATLLSASPQSRTFTGVITDDMCGKSHEKMRMGEDPNCVRACVKSHGSKFSLFDGSNAYKLSDQATPERFAGQKVKVTGTLYEKTGIIKVEKIEPIAQ
ncbi:MAG: hypothetical protein HY820_19085 [Acidobacteria bacterium]|nr:hypothetical protein [Acidobacteriota bacterium]